jgi:hypothetical protein
MSFVDFLSAFSSVAFVVGALFLMGMASKRRRAERRLRADWTHFLAHELVHRGYLFNTVDEESIQKLEAVLEDLDQDWHWRNKLDTATPLERFASYLGNTEFRSARV